MPPSALTTRPTASFLYIYESLKLHSGFTHLASNKKLEMNIPYWSNRGHGDSGVSHFISMGNPTTCSLRQWIKETATYYPYSYIIYLCTCEFMCLFVSKLTLDPGKCWISPFCRPLRSFADLSGSLQTSLGIYRPL